jgi:hypothetical protein
VFDMGGKLDPRLANLGPDWCACEDAPWLAHGPLTLLDHPDDCGFPAQPCGVRAHHMSKHKSCGLLMPMRFCGCLALGYTFDPARGWWVDVECGWPSRAWFKSCGKLAPGSLMDVKPVTFHEFVIVPRTPKKAYEHLTDEQRRLNEECAGGWVRD